MRGKKQKTDSELMPVGLELCCQQEWDDQSIIEGPMGYGSVG